LIEAAEVLKNVNGISFNFFDEADVVRHVLVQRIVRAYEDHKRRVEKAQQLSLLPEAHPAEPLLGESATPVLEQ
jgi:phosphate starvation-inducible protein PhoH